MNPFVRLDDKTKIELEAYAEKLVAKAQSVRPSLLRPFSLVVTSAD